MRNFLYNFLRCFLFVVLKVIYRLKYTGFEKFPLTGPALLVANHTSFMDSQVLLAAVSRPISFIVYKPIYNLPFIYPLMKLSRSIPIDANKKDVSFAIAQVGQLLAKGHVVCIFPEGRITSSGNLRRFKFGVEWILEQNPVPVYPIYIKGFWGSIWSRKYENKWHRFIPKDFRRKIELRLGKPLKPTDAKINHLQEIVMNLADDEDFIKYV